MTYLIDEGEWLLAATVIVGVCWIIGKVWP